MAERWSDYEIRYLTESAGQKEPEQIGDHLGRSKMAVVNYARKHGISLAIHRAHWTDAEDTLLLSHKAAGKSARQIGEILDRTPKAIDHRFRLLKDRQKEQG